MSVEAMWVAKPAALRPKWRVFGVATFDHHRQFSCIRACQPIDDKNKFYKELGLFSLRKRIEDAIARAELTTYSALEFEEARQIKQEEMVQKYNLWDDLTKSDEILSALAISTKVVEALKDLQHKAEEVKLITELAEMDAINYRLFKQAYNASVDVSKFLDHYEMSKLLCGLYDMEGACMTITAVPDAADAELWAERLLTMYTKWGKKHGYNWRVIEKCSSKHGGIRSSTIEFESKFVYGFLSGERGKHQMIRKSHDDSVLCQTSCVAVDVIPIFLEEAPGLTIDDQDLQVSLIPKCGNKQHGGGAGSAVSICHVPTGIEVQCSGERNRFANKMKAMNRLKAKLLVAAAQQSVFDVKKLKRPAITDVINVETRRYIFQPYKLVHDVKTGIQLPDLTSILDGNLEPLIGVDWPWEEPIGNRRATTLVAVIVMSPISPVIEIRQHLGNLRGTQLHLCIRMLYNISRRAEGLSSLVVRSLTSCNRNVVSSFHNLQTVAAYPTLGGLGAGTMGHLQNQPMTDHSTPFKIPQNLEIIQTGS
ncbi:hypothetical protein H6P81_003688 [Aristolochia fimbriata]|uniref:Peptide chain release factor domain-containing protein n=1 Tax=Aristolochia fimbriata TaxID=158543 RepID=A0AAV7FDB5_ARIFI|nr:hypothetical protein H6P81_003688 [Aristolochia fimbriata]